MSRTGFDRRDLLALAAGGALGAGLRWAIAELTPDDAWFPSGTLMANVLGCAVLGAVVALRRQHPDRGRLWLAAGTGFCGSLTTFSTFAVELAGFLGAPGPFETSSPARALLYLTASVAAGATAFLATRANVRTAGTGRR